MLKAPRLRLTLDHKDGGAFLGFTGLTHPGYKTPSTPCVEVRWRLHRAA